MLGKKIGILGGGQLGKMLCEAASPWSLETWVLDEKADFPAASVCKKFVEGSFRKKEDVLAFGRQVDVLTVEIEAVNLEALFELEREGLEIHPRPAALEIIRDKGLQKQFFEKNGIPTAEFELFEDEKALLEAVKMGRWPMPFVQKTRRDGYDGKGVAILRTEKDLATKLLKGPCLAEKMVDLQAELAVIACQNPAGELATFPTVEMEFDPEANLVELLVCPARVSPLVAAEAEALAERTIRAFGLCGLLAVEFFLDKTGQLLVNEVAPRPHNSGHHTIDAAMTSQFQQHLRGVLNLPLGATDATRAAAMVNLLGADNFRGPAKYEGIEKCLAEPGVFIHLYGKVMTAPMRKMGHATAVGATVEEAMRRARVVQENLRIVA